MHFFDRQIELERRKKSMNKRIIKERLLDENEYLIMVVT